MTFFIGTSGWSYNHWDGVLYPPGTPPAKRLACYVEHFSTVELNASFYRWPGERTFQGWEHRLPEGFTMTVKAPRGLTHAKRLREPEQWLARITHSLEQLGARRGVLLVQLPPDMPCDLARLDFFLAHAPAGQRVAVELRHASWHHDETFALLEQHGAAYCVMSGAHLPCILRVTAPFVYVRLHGPDPHHLYGGSYSDDALRWWAARLHEWAATGRDVYAYLNNDGWGHAVRNAATLRRLVEG